VPFGLDTLEFRTIAEDGINCGENSRITGSLDEYHRLLDRSPIAIERQIISY
jgi:hypothetical protein